MYKATFRADGIASATVTTFSLKAMSLDYREWIGKLNLGASQCRPVMIQNMDGKDVYILGYNGTVWHDGSQVEV